MFPEISLNDIPTVNTDQMIEIDRTMVEYYHIEPIQMMENAGRNLAHLARERFFSGNPEDKNILAMAGSGGNGGDALVAARLLSNWGANVVIALGKEPEKMTSLAEHQLKILQRMDVRGTQSVAIIESLESQNFDLILDGLIGFSLKGAPYGLMGELIRYANSTNIPILSVDTPSGIDTTSGTIYDPTIRATATLTLALPKTGLFTDEAPKYVGELYLADISVPPKLYNKPTLSLSVSSFFSRSEIIKLQH